MRARIVQNSEKTIVLKTEKDAFLKLPKKDIAFEYKLGDWVTIEKNGDEIYVLPQDSSDFWNAEDTDIYREADNFAISSLILNLLAIVASFLNLWNLYAGLIWVALAGLSLIFAALSKTKKSSLYKAARITMWVSLMFYLVLLVIVLCTAIGSTL